MRRIFAIGETVFDIIFKDGKPITSTPGGSLLNTAVTLGRLGLDVYFRIQLLHTSSQKSAEYSFSQTNF